MSKSWGSTKGTTSSDKLDYVKFKNGKQTFRIVSGVEPSYAYWIKNKEDKVAPFPCIRFDRDKERWIQGAKDPVQDMGFKEPKPVDGKVVPLKCKKNYTCWAIDRSDGKLKIMTVKDGILKGIQSIMGQLDLEDPSQIDITINRTGASWNDTEYTVEAITAMKFLGNVQKEGTPEYKQHEADFDLIGLALPEGGFEKVKPLREIFPIPTYDEQKAAIEAFLEGRQDKPEGSDTASGTDGANDQEAASDLDD
jgi:hypothetical protein